MDVHVARADTHVLPRVIKHECSRVAKAKNIISARHDSYPEMKKTEDIFKL